MANSSLTSKTGGACPKCGEPYTPFPVHMCLRPYGPLKGDKQPSRGDHMTAKQLALLREAEGLLSRYWIGGQAANSLARRIRETLGSSGRSADETPAGCPWHGDKYSVACVHCEDIMRQAKFRDAVRWS